HHEYINTMKIDNHHLHREVMQKLTEIDKLNNELTILSSRLDNRDEEFEDLQFQEEEILNEIARLQDLFRRV
ncbi:18713_t:CDS:2, partial [Funneliformis geosporum]